MGEWRYLSFEFNLSVPAPRSRRWSLCLPHPLESEGERRNVVVFGDAVCSPSVLGRGGWALGVSSGGGHGARGQRGVVGEGADLSSQGRGATWARDGEGVEGFSGSRPFRGLGRPGLKG